ncbi:acyl-CoA dehydrogenase [Agrococcus baldri]|uniref:Acyl-CoA dehydrogenase n=2 Tax=Agrococcus baldri TaxID=153730 RepID=A0AA87UR36_9MICO|nr:acyl-CoA dehydrogenase [Agrococcus baldri]
MDFAYSPEQADLSAHLRNWMDAKVTKAQARAWEADEGNYPVRLWNLMTEQGLHAVGLPEEYGGAGSGVMDQMIVCRELSRNLGGLSFVWGVSSFCAKSVALYAQEVMKRELLPRLAAGEIRMSIAVTEPGGGTDLLGGMRTTASKVDGGWRINGQKIWSTGAKAADYLLVLARTDPHASKPSRGVTMFLIPNPAAGLQIEAIPKLGMRSMSSCSVFLDDVFVAEDHVIGEVNRGWYQMLPTLNNERIMIAAMCAGVMDAVLEDALEYMQHREAFGRPIGQFQALQHYIADIAMWRQQASLMTNHAAWLQETGQPCGTESMMAKVVATEHAGHATDLGIQILGGMGYAQETDMQRYWRDVRLFRIGPITSEMSRNSIAESFGLPRSF